jgi:hypothetical protein
MAHGVELEIAEGDSLHLAVTGVVFDPVLVPPEAVARMQHRAVRVGDARQLVEPAAGEHAEPLEMRLQVSTRLGRQIERQQLLQPRIDRVEILPGAVRRDMRGLHHSLRGLRLRERLAPTPW